MKRCFCVCFATNSFAEGSDRSQQRGLESEEHNWRTVFCYPYAIVAADVTEEGRDHTGTPFSGCDATSVGADQAGAEAAPNACDLQQSGAALGLLLPQRRWA